VRYTDFLKTTVLLAAGEATALAAVTIAVVAGDDDRTALYFSLGWWVLAVIIGIWLGRRTETTTGIARLLAQAKSVTTLPPVRPGLLLLNRLWLMIAIAVVAAGTAWLVPQFAAVAAGGLIIVALAWRKQDRAVTAIEERDGIQYYVVPSSPFGAIELVRAGGFKRLRGNSNGAGRV
jgi:uncharacterized membrane protein SirB2